MVVVCSTYLKFSSCRKLLHILKFICLNTVAVRKICRKHDRLSKNRMLGGYYHRSRLLVGQEESTLGGLLSSSAGDLLEVHPSHMAISNHGKLMGVLDLQLQQLANSRTVKMISSCLALTLSEYEVSHCRADALAQLSHPSDVISSRIPARNHWRFPSSYHEQDKNPTVWERSDPAVIVHASSSDDELDNGPRSTASTISLARLQYSVLAIAALREASRIKYDPFSTYVGRTQLLLIGQTFPGEGLGGSSRDALDLLLSFNPDSALLLDPTSIYAGLNYGQWNKSSLADAMRSSLAVAMILPLKGPGKKPVQVSAEDLTRKERIIEKYLGVLPPSNSLLLGTSLDNVTATTHRFMSVEHLIDFPPALLQANRWCWFLYYVSECAFLLQN
jgi:hypothetical protein